MVALGFADHGSDIINKSHGIQNPSPETVLFLIAHLNFAATREDIKAVCPILLKSEAKGRH